MNTHPADIANVTAVETTYPCTRMREYDDKYVAKLETGTCTFNGEPARYTIAVTLDHAAFTTEAEIHGAILDPNTARPIRGFRAPHNLDTAEWDLVEAFIPRNEWPRELWYGPASMGNNTPDMKLRDIIDAFDTEQWIPGIRDAKETGWATSEDIAIEPRDGYTMTGLRSGDCTIREGGTHAAWLIAEYGSHEGNSYKVAWLGHTTVFSVAKGKVMHAGLPVGDPDWKYNDQEIVGELEAALANAE